MKSILIAVLILSFSFADTDDYKKELHLPNDLSFLKLNNDQKEKLKHILKEHRIKLKKLHEKEEEWEEELKKEFVKDKFDKEEFKRKNLAIKKRIVEIEAEFFEKIHSILNKEQREEFIEYIEEWEIE